jgi:hypothetical protein
MNLKLHKLLFLTFFVTTSIFSQKKLWNKTTINYASNSLSIDLLEKENSETLTLNFNEFREQLIGTPLRNDIANKKKSLISLPDQNGKLQEFSVFEAAVFAPSLSAKFPNIKSYVGFSTDNSGAVVRMSVSQKGVQTMISYKDKPTVFMQPLDDSTEEYIVYNRLSKVNLPKEDFICSTANELVESDNVSVNQRDANDQTLRKFRLAISVNGEYTTYHGGTVAGALAAINATITRVNAVFETDMAITYEVQDFPELIYTDAATDPYSGSLSAWNVELQNTLTDVIGNAAYDIGHMFGASGGGGNAGCIGCVCRDDTASTSDENKGAGITSPADGIPEGDTFDIDYVAHEIGHQMGANHTFSHSTEGTGVNAEPGSGSTIMGYAGITSSNVQQNSDDYFHYHSIKQITDNVTNTRTCWQANSPVTLTNNPPNANAGIDVTIPQGTAYVLRGTATDADSEDNLMYSWEQTDSGLVTRTQFGPTRTIGAQARSLPASNSSDRYIPKLSRVVAGQLTETNPNSGDDWETVSTVARELNWALTVRDRQPTATGLNGQSSFDLMKITVDDTSGPFVVTSPNSAVSWDVGSVQTITWDVAGTNAGNVNTPKVNILLSVDGGVTFPYSLGSDIDNNGSYSFSVPVTGQGDTTQARIIVEGKDNIFYSMNTTDFSITESEFTLAVSNPDLAVCSPNDAVYNFTYNTFLGFTGTTTFSTTGLPSGATVTFSPTTASVDGTVVTATVSNIASVAQDSYGFDLVGTSGSITKSANVLLQVYSGTVENITLTSPSDGASGTQLTTTLVWEADSNIESYDIEVATDNTFTNIISSGNVTTNSYNLSGLSETTLYYWRVKGKNPCGEGNYSSIFSFTTINCTACEANGNTSYATSTTLVNFNTIDNISGKPSGYSDYTSMSTTVKKGETHTITVNANTDGSYRIQSKVWIDWNGDCDFDDADEEYDLGFANTTPDGPTDMSPLSITIPSGATIGSTIMRVSTRYTSSSFITYPTSCETGFDGEIEDYTVIVEDATASIEDFAFSGFNLYPNPSTGMFTLNLELINTEKVSVQLFDVRGRLINEKNFFNKNTAFSEEINFNNTAKGLYLVKITNGNKQTTRKLIIE